MIKKFIANSLWKIARLSPEWGNRIMDLVGYENYCHISRIQTVTKSKSD